MSTGIESPSGEQSLKSVVEWLQRLVGAEQPAQIIAIVRVLDELENAENVFVVASRGTRLGMKGLLFDAAVRLDELLLK